MGQPNNGPDDDGDMETAPDPKGQMNEYVLQDSLKWTTSRSLPSGQTENPAVWRNGMDKAAKDLTRGDKVLDLNGDYCRVEAVSKGFWPGSVLVTWWATTASGKDWSCINRDAILEVC